MELVIRFYLVLLFGGASAQGTLILRLKFGGCLLIAMSQWRQQYNNFGGSKYSFWLSDWPLLTIESPVAQWLEHPTRSRRVVGSNPTWDSNFFRVLLTFNKHKLKVDCNMISFRSCLKSSLIPVLAERQIISWKQTSHHVTQTSRADWVIASGFVSETKQSLQGLGNFS